ncbi:uncharacterized protein SCHCODRAFT_02076188 [Schizophyllum commune H4-8]|uniref:uncharacterized protein n=1 Tax=Schizophyllum commune (strain H4-8 / FGSC 9210) TaxID=578458 RepID=UPI0021605ECF|nr:uncharacterized protein SCHCODRAFT_02076188 [Schizophyllum commune H4-8]KAI5887957.1 hypothetical protein SCHCODRAFT_02076188 [Schizophyllum commune H4-8]
MGGVLAKENPPQIGAVAMCRVFSPSPGLLTQTNAFGMRSKLSGHDKPRKSAGISEEHISQGAVDPDVRWIIAPLMLVRRPLGHRAVCCKFCKVVSVFTRCGGSLLAHVTASREGADDEYAGWNLERTSAAPHARYPACLINLIWCANLNRAISYGSPAL